MKFIVCFLAAFTWSVMQAQPNALIVPANIRLPKDSILRTSLISSIDGFLSMKDKSVKENSYVKEQDWLETSALLEEMKGIDSSQQFNNKHLFKPYLCNVVQLTDSTYLIQLSYMGINNNMPALRASFTVIAQLVNHHFCFSSPLKLNTSVWKTQIIGTVTFHYKSTLNAGNARKYARLISEFDTKLGAPSIPTEHYCCDNLHEALALTGIDYKSDYTGYRLNSLSSQENSRHLNVNGVFTAEFKDVDPHDLWHSRLYKVVSRSVINRPVDEGSAYLYGGSWGMTWPQILKKFKVYAQANPDADWINLYNASKDFNHEAKFPLNVDMAINALIVQKISKEKGINGVIELLSCGNKNRDNDNYFSALEKITGITRANFNSEVWTLLGMQKPSETSSKVSSANPIRQAE